jgi:hypothetical protein
MNRNPVAMAGTATVCVLLAGGWAVWSIWGSLEVAPDSVQYSTDSFYSTDDGASYFRDSGDRLSPFIRDGKTAVRAHVFTCDRGKTRFVGYLERVSEEGKRRLAAIPADANAPEDLAARNAILLTATEVKKPLAASAWIPQRRRAEAQVVMDVRCPDGTGTVPEPVMP